MKRVIMVCSRWLTLASGAVVIVLGATACERAESDHSGAEVEPASFESLFDSVRTVILSEPDTAPVTAITALRTGRGGQFVVADGPAATVRVYDRHGTLTGTVGQRGRGPGEFLDLSAAAMTSNGRICATDARLNRLTCFTGISDSAVVSDLPGSGGLTINSGDGDIVVVAIQPAPRESQVAVVTPTGEVVGTFFTQDSAYSTRPYWNSLYGVSLAVGQSRIYAATRLFYPVRIFDVNGDSVGAIGGPTRSWRAAQIVEGGRFAGPMARRELIDWLRQTTVISQLLLIHDSVLAVVQGEYRPSENDPPPVFFRVHPSTLTLYRTTGELIAEDLVVPGTPIYSDSLLYILKDTPSSGWTIVAHRPTIAR